MEPVVGFEPTTDGLQNRCSTTELNWPRQAAAAGVADAGRSNGVRPIDVRVERVKLLAADASNSHFGFRIWGLLSSAGRFDRVQRAADKIVCFLLDSPSPFRYLL